MDQDPINTHAALYTTHEGTLLPLVLVPRGPPLLLATLPCQEARLLPSHELLAERLHAHGVQGVRRADPASRQDHQHCIALLLAPHLLRVAGRALRGLRRGRAALPELDRVPRVEACVGEEPVGGVEVETRGSWGWDVPCRDYVGLDLL